MNLVLKYLKYFENVKNDIKHTKMKSYMKEINYSLNLNMQNRNMRYFVLTNPVPGIKMSFYFNLEKNNFDLELYILSVAL